MEEKRDVTILILRFIFGAILGGLLSLVLMLSITWISIPTPKVIFWIIGGTVTLFAAISATIWGDSFIMGIMKVFKIFKYSPSFLIQWSGGKLNNRLHRIANKSGSRWAVALGGRKMDKQIQGWCCRRLRYLLPVLKKWIDANVQRSGVKSLFLTLALEFGRNPVNGTATPNPIWKYLLSRDLPR